MKKKLYASMAAAAVLLAAGCTNQTAKTISSTAGETSASSGGVSSVSSLTGRDLTTSDELLNTEKFREQIKTAERSVPQNCYSYSANTWDMLYHNATEIVRCRVEKTGFTMFLDQVNTKFDVTLLEVLKGDLRPGDRISVLNLGGYVSKLEYEKAREPEWKTKFTQSQIENWGNTILEVRDMDSQYEAYPTAEEEYVLFLRTIPNDKHRYFPSTSVHTMYLHDGSGRYTRTPGRKKAEGTAVSGNSIESFTFDWLKEQIGREQ